MADVNSNININIDASEALATIKALQRQISAFHTSMAKSGAAANAISANMQQNLMNAVNATNKWQATLKTIPTTTESFTRSLEKNKFTMREYFRYAGGATRTFGKLFKSEFDTINKVARERVKDLQTQYIKLGRDANGAMKAMAIRPLSLDMKDYGTQVQIAAQRQQILNQLLKQGSTNLLNFGKNTQWAGRQLMVGFTIPLAYLGTAASKTFMKLEEQAIRFKRVYGEMFTTGAETNKMLKEIELLAKEFTKYGVSVEKTMEMAATAAASGKMGAELLAQVNEATRLAVLGGVEQEQALETTISLTNAFGLAAEDLAKKINFLNAVENQTVVSIEDLTVAIPKAGPVVEQLGGSVEDLAFFLTAMKEGGINASEGANALKSGLASLINPTDKAAEMLGNMGININGIVEANKGNVKQVVIDFAKALDTLDPLNRARAIEQLFGKFQFARLSTLFTNVVAEGNQASRVLKLTQATTEELAILSERELSRIEESTTYKFKKTIEDLKVTLAPVGEQFLKALTPIVEFVSKILDKFNNLGDGTKKFITILTVALGGLGPILLMSFGLLANGLANIIKLFTSIKGVMNRAGQSSQTLGQQTDYMTTEQMQAATVAASLEQVHARLIQTFTSEAGAVAALTTAYKNAIAAQLAFTGPVRGGAGKTPKKFNMGTGGVKYYAKGTDTVPAMLTPGEAVIPAEQAQDPRNKPFIQAMLQGQTVQGFMAGTDAAYAHAAMPFSPGSPQYAQGIKIAGLEQLASQFPQFIRVVSNLVAELPQRLNVLMQKGTAPVEQFTKAYEGRTGKFLGAAKLGGMDISNPKLTSALAKLEQEVGRRTVEMAKNAALEKDAMLNLKKGTTKVVVSDELFAKATRSVIDDYMKLEGSAKTAAVALDTASKQIGQVRMNFSTAALRAGLLSGVFKKVKGQFQSQANIVAGGVNVGRESASKPGKFYPANPVSPTGSYARLKGKFASVVDQLPKAAEEALQTKSPSRRMRKIGQDAAAGLVLGAKEFIDDAKVAGQQLGAAATSGVTQAGRKRRVATRDQGPPPIGPVAPPGATVLPIVSKPAAPEPKGRISTYLANRKAARAEAGKPGMGGGGAMMAASGVMMAASMAPGKIGETAQKLMMPMMALTMLFPLLQSKMGALAVGAGLLVAAFAAARMAFDKAQDAALKLTEEMGSGTSAMQSLAKFAGNVTGAEVMSRRRQNALSPFQIQTGKTTFGESFVQSEAGKGMLSNVGQMVKTSGRGAAQAATVNQLASGVLSGAIDAAQARSIAANLAKELGDYSFGINVNAKLIELLGPNGENALKDPIGIRVKLLQDTRERAAMGTEAARKAGGFRAGDAGKTLGFSVAGGLGGAAAGAVAGAAIGSAVPVVGTIIGAALGVGVGAFLAQRDRNKRIGEASGASIALQKTALEQQQQMLDSLDLEYQQKIANAKAAGDQAEAERLTNEYLAGRNKLLDENGKLVGDIQKSFAESRGATRDALMTGVDKAITKQYKGTALEDVAPLAKTMIGDSGLSEEKQFTLKMQLASGQIDPMQMMQIFETFGKDKGSIDKVVNIVGKFGGAFANQVMGVVGMFKDKQQAADFVARISTKTSEQAQKELELFQNITKVGQVVDVNVALNYYNKNPKAAAALQKTIDAINEQKGKISLKVATTILGAKEMEVLRANQEYFNSLPPEQQKVYLQTLTTMVNMEGNNKEAIQNWLKANPGKTEGDYYADSAWKITQASKDTTKPTTTPGPTGDKKGPDPSALDDLTKKLRDVQKNQIKVTTGWSASMAALRKFAGDASKTALPFSGIEQDLMKLKTSMGKPLVTGNFIEFITGMDPAEYEKRKKQLFNFDAKGNIVGLKKDAKTIQEVLNSIVAGDFQSNLKKQKIELQNQTIAYEKLVKLGVPVSQAYELIADASFAAMIATIKNKDKVKELIKEYNLFKKTLGEAQDKQSFDISLEELEKTPTNIQNQRKAVALLTAQGVSYGDALAFVQDETVANHVANKANAETLTRLAEAAKKAAEATKQFGIAQQFAARIQEFKDTLENFNNQRAAITKLVAAGFSLADAYSIVQDSAIAATIAQTANNDLIKSTGRDALAAAEALKKMAAAQSIVSANQATADTRSILAFLNANKGNFTNEQIKAILENKDLQTLILDPTIDPAALQEAIDNAAMNADLEFQIKKLTIEGMEEIFNDGFNKAMEAFDAEEKAITLKFKADTAYLTDPETGIIPIAENAIAQLQYQIDDWEAGLKGIEEQEQAINDSYDAKFKALDEVQKINEKIARQQKQQLTLADALSQGDISAAAAAIQEMRAANAADQADVQRQSLEAAKENQLANVRNALGMTRKQIEEQIKNLQKEIFNIEETQLEPAREALRLRERQRDIDISNITVLGRTKDAWEAIKNGIDLAKTRSDLYKDAMQAALDIVKDIEDYWNNKVPKEKTTIHNIITKYSTEGSPADCCAGAGVPDDTPDTGGCKGTPTSYNEIRVCNGKPTMVTIKVDECGKESWDCPPNPDGSKDEGCKGTPTSYAEVRVCNGKATMVTIKVDACGKESWDCPPPPDGSKDESPCPPGFVLNSRGSCAPASNPEEKYDAPSAPAAKGGAKANGSSSGILVTGVITEGYTAPKTNTKLNAGLNTVAEEDRPFGGANIIPKPGTQTAPHDTLGKSAGAGSGTKSGYTAPKAVTSTNTGSNTVAKADMPFSGQSIIPKSGTTSAPHDTLGKSTGAGTGTKSGSSTKNDDFPLQGNPKSGTTATVKTDTKTETKSTTVVTLPFGGSILKSNIITGTKKDDDKEFDGKTSKGSLIAVPIPLPISTGGGKSDDKKDKKEKTESAPHDLAKTAGSPKKSTGGGGGGFGGLEMIASGGIVKPAYRALGGVMKFLTGGFSRGTDTVPAMLTPGEFVVSRPAVNEYGVDRLKAINNGSYDDASVYNYNLSVTLNGSNMNANDVANVVLQKIKQVESQRIRRQTV